MVASSDVVSNKALKEVVRSLRGYHLHNLGQELGLRGGDIDDIAHTFSYSLQEQMFQMLVTWKSRFGCAATAEVLQEKLESIGAKNVADKLYRLTI